MASSNRASRQSTTKTKAQSTARTQPTKRTTQPSKPSAGSSVAPKATSKAAAQAPADAQGAKRKKAPKRKHQSKTARYTPAFIAMVAVIVCFVAAVLILYPVAHDFYVAKRHDDRLNAEYQAILERNEKIQGDIDQLYTPEGVADRAREKFGWVREGEQAVNITGLPIGDSTTELPQTVLPGSVESEGDWLTLFLDEFFGVEPAETPALEQDPVPGL
jgi:cell division protein FtsB